VAEVAFLIIYEVLPMSVFSSERRLNFRPAAPTPFDSTSGRHPRGCISDQWRGTKINVRLCAEYTQRKINPDNLINRNVNAGPRDFQTFNSLRRDERVLFDWLINKQQPLAFASKKDTRLLATFVREIMSDKSLEALSSNLSA